MRDCYITFIFDKKAVLTPPKTCYAFMLFHNYYITFCNWQKEAVFLLNGVFYFYFLRISFKYACILCEGCCAIFNYLMVYFTFISSAQTLNALVPYGKVVMPLNDLNLLLSLFFSAISLVSIVSTEDGVLFILYCTYLTVSLLNKHFL